jgi:hypothetical protein
MQSAQVAALRNGEEYQFDNEVRELQGVVDGLRRAIAEHDRTHGCC